MSHPEQREFFAHMQRRLPTFFAHVTVLEIGSLDINGTVRDFFVDCEYTGVDLAEGPGVDVVANGEELDFPDRSFDVVVSAECFEHNPHWKQTFQNMHRMANGIVIVTAATDGRPEHGTSRSRPEDSPLTATTWDYYGNISPEDLEAFPLDEMFVRWSIRTNEFSHDIYFWGLVNGSGELGLRNRVLARHDAAASELVPDPLDVLNSATERDQACAERDQACAERDQACAERDQILRSHIWRWTAWYRRLRGSRLEFPASSSE